MPRRHHALIDEKHATLGEVLDRVFGDRASARKEYRNEIRDRLKASAGDLGIDIQKLKLRAVVAAVMRFLLDSFALPPRTPARLAPTLRAVARNPQQFLDTSDSYDPEVVVRVIDRCSSASCENRNALLAWELGHASPAIPPEEISKAARAVLADLQSARQLKASGAVPEAPETAASRAPNSALAGLSLRGRPRNHHIVNLSIALARVFVNSGGALHRNVRISEPGETGNFHAFLDIVLEPVRSVAFEIGVVLTTSTIVAHALDNVKPSPSKREYQKGPFNPSP